ncbi:MAG: AsmA-like C-terminal region-containing protein, partial [Maricaulis sp.]
APAGDAAPAAGGGIPPWSEEAIDFAGLGIADADLSLNVGRLLVRDIEVTDAALRAVVDNRRLQAVLERISLYEGQGNVTIVANARTATPSFSLDASLAGLDALPFLDAAAGFDRLAGTGAMTLSLATSGNSQAAMMRNLGGNGEFNFADGAIVGINIAETIRNVSGFLDRSGGAQAADTSEDDSEQASVGERQETDFSSLGGTFAIANGRLTNNDLLMLSPLLRVEGQGWVDLPSQTLDYRLRPRAVASIEGQGGSTDLQGIVVPIRFRGDFNNVGYGVDTEAVTRALLQGALSNAIGGDRNQSPEDAARDALRNALGLGNRNDEATDGEEGQTDEEEVDPAEQLLRGLFNQRRDRSQSDETDDNSGDPN